MLKRQKKLWIIIPVSLCVILVIVNMVQYFQFYKVLNAVYEICKESSDSESAIGLMKYAGNLETEGLLSTGLTIISIAVTVWIGLNMYNIINKELPV